MLHIPLRALQGAGDAAGVAAIVILAGLVGPHLVPFPGHRLSTFDG